MKDLFLGFDFLGEIFVILWEERFYVICMKIIYIFGGEVCEGNISFEVEIFIK
jgi:hypothetical protein